MTAAESRPRETVIACALPGIEAADRALMPLGIGMLLLFITAWAVFSGWFLSERIAWSRDSAVTEAIVGADNLVQYRDRRGQEHRTYPPSREGWRPQPGERLDIRYVEGQEQIEFADMAEGQRLLALGFAAFSLPMYGFAYYVFRRLRKDDARRARLKSLNRRVPAQDFRVLSERVGGKSHRIGYRVFARFNHQGRWYEAASDRLGIDPTPGIDPDVLCVLLDPDEPLMSMVSQETIGQ